jgi:4-amino-4-deoxy-L-arabinose transferase-like glycosyltransferase
MTDERPAFAWRPVGLVVAVQATLLLAMAPHYGPHRDELYFVSAGERLAWGYPDQPSFTPLVARLSTEVAEHHLVVLRLWSILAVAGLVLLAVQYTRLLGGGRPAQVLTAVTVAASAVTMTVGHRLSTATFDTLAWTAVLVLVTQALVDDRPRLWLGAGIVAGVGLNNKHAVAFLLLGILVALALDRRARPALRTPWPWVAGCYAVLLWVPNLIWQWRHDWPALELSADIADEYGGIGGRVGMLGEAFAMFSPFLGVLWVIGTFQLLRRPDWGAARLPAYVFIVVTAVLLVTGGKGYYLAGAIVPLLAAGCTWLALRWSGRRLVLTGAGLAVSAMVAWPALVPVLPVQTFADSFYAGLNDDQVETIGWDDYAAQVRAVVAEAPEGAVVFTGNYGEAGAFEWYGVGAPVLSGHNGFQDWGPPPETAVPVVVVGYRGPPAGFTGCERVATLTSAVDVDNEEQGGPVWLCDGPVGGWEAAWDRLAHYDA